MKKEHQDGFDEPTEVINLRRSVPVAGHWAAGSSERVDYVEPWSVKADRANGPFSMAAEPEEYHPSLFAEDAREQFAQVTGPSRFERTVAVIRDLCIIVLTALLIYTFLEIARALTAFQQQISSLVP